MARNDKKKQHTFEKKVKEKKETILIEVLKSEKDKAIKIKLEREKVNGYSDMTVRVTLK